MEGDEIVILNGPLMNQTGLIKKLDRHKRLAYLEMEILGRRNRQNRIRDCSEMTLTTQ